MSDPAPTYRPRCMYLCCKSMVVYGENFESDPDYQAGMTDFWCMQTSRGQGPERACFKEY
jgi:hypothetical protein